MQVTIPYSTSKTTNNGHKLHYYVSYTTQQAHMKCLRREIGVISPRVIANKSTFPFQHTKIGWGKIHVSRSLWLHAHVALLHCQHRKMSAYEIECTAHTHAKQETTIQMYNDSRVLLMAMKIPHMQSVVVYLDYIYIEYK